MLFQTISYQQPVAWGAHFHSDYFNCFLSSIELCQASLLPATLGLKSSGNGNSTAASFKRIFLTRIDAPVKIKKLNDCDDDDGDTDH